LGVGPRGFARIARPGVVSNPAKNASSPSGLPMVAARRHAVSGSSPPAVFEEIGKAGKAI